MLDLRDSKTIDLDLAEEIKAKKTYRFQDQVTGKDLVAKIFSTTRETELLLAEFKKMALLSGEPEIGSTYFLAKAKLNGESYDCYVMDFIKGTTLADFLSSKSVDAETAIQFISDIAAGLEKAHAHEIFHGDIHDENIIITELGYLKIIDFYWYNFNSTNEEKCAADVKHFRSIVSQISAAVLDDDKSLWEPVSNLCLNQTTFRGLRQKIASLSRVLLDISLLNQNSFLIAAAVLKELKSTFKLSMSYHIGGIQVPLEWSYPEEERGAPFDLRAMNIEAAIRGAFEKEFRELVRAGLFKVTVTVKDTRDDNRLIPYTFSYWIEITPKAVEWWRVNKVSEFLPDPNIDSLHEYILQKHNPPPSFASQELPYGKPPPKRIKGKKLEVAEEKKT